MDGLSDTDPQVARLQLELLRQSSPARRFTLMAGWSQMLMLAAYNQSLQRFPDEPAARLAWIRQQYGPEVAKRLERHLCI